MSDISIATLSFDFDTSGLLRGIQGIDQLTTRTNAASEALDRLNAKAAAAMKNVPAAFGGGGGGQAAASAATAGAGAQTALNAATAGATAAIGAQAKALHGGAAAHGAHGAAVYANRMQMLELGHVGRALFDEMAAGGNVFRALAMEGGRLQVALATGEGGLAGTIGRVATSALGLANPFTIGAGVVAGLGAAAVLATSHVRDMQVEMDRAVGGAGRFTGLTGQGLDDLATGRAASAGLSLGNARSTAMDLARTGRLDASSIGDALGLTRGYADATGTGVDKAGEGLAKIFADPARGMGDLEKAVGLLDDCSRQAITSLQAQGDAQAAVRVLVDRTSTSLNEMVKPQGPWDRFVQQFSDRNARLEGLIAGAVAGPTPQQQYAAASRAGGSLGLLGTLQSRGLYDDGTTNLAEDFRHSAMLRGATPFMRSEADDLRANQQSQAAGDIIRRTLPDIGARQLLVDDQASLTKALGNPDVLAKLGLNAADAFEALDRINTGLATFKSGLQRLVEEGDMAVRQASARTAAEKAAADADQAYARTLDQTHSRLEAAQAAENSRNEAIAQSTRTALDALRATSDRAALSGLSPYDRMMRENDQRFRDLQERTITGPVASGTAIMVPGVSSAYATPDMLAAAAQRTGLPANLIAALGQVENGGRLSGGTDIRDANGRPASSAYGFGQITRGAEADIRTVLPGFDRTNPDTAVLGAATYLKQLVDRNHGDTRAALGAYAGPDPGHNGTGNRAYVDNVLRLAGGPQAAAAGFSVDPAAAGLANRVNFAVGRIDDATNLLMRGPTQSELQIGGQSRMLATQRDTFGQSAGLIAKATEAQREWNEVTATGASRMGLIKDFGAAGAKMWDDLTAKINANAAAAGRLAQQQQDEQNRQQLMSAVGSDAADVFSAGTIGALTGKGFGNSARSALSGIGEQLIHSGFSGLFGSVFGGGKSGGGILGSLLPGHMFASGTEDAPAGPALVGEKGPELVNLPAHAQVIPNSALASMRAPSVQMGDTHVHIHPVGGAQFTDQQILQINGQVAQGVQQGNQQVIDHMTRSLPQIQADAQQFA